MVDERDPEAEQMEIQQAISRLAHFNPSFKDDCGHQVVDYLVLDSLAVFGQVQVSGEQVCKSIAERFKVDYEEAEIEASGRRLAARGLADYTVGKRGGRDILRISEGMEAKISENLLRIQKLETEVIDAWMQEVAKKYEDFPVVAENARHIVASLQLFLSRMFVRHGIDCVMLLYPEEQKAINWLESVRENIMEGLPTLDHFTDAVVKTEIPAFFREPDESRMRYITSLINSSFYWHLAQVDEKCSRLLQATTKGQRLFLDNNIIYSLVGLHGQCLLASVHSLLRFAVALGYELWVTTKTLDEFHESLKWQLQEHSSAKAIPTELARIALETLSEDSFLASYWKEFVKSGISMEDFVAEKSHLEEILMGLSIKKTDELRKEIEESEELRKQESYLSQVKSNESSAKVIEHDAFHRVLVTWLRNGSKYRFTEAGVWFLTHDHRLPEYDRVARKGAKYLPFCITTDQWIQINRPLLIRTANTDEYERSFQTLVTQPFLRTMVSTLSMERAYREVMGRLAKFMNMKPTLASRIVSDRHFMMTMWTSPGSIDTS